MTTKKPVPRKPFIAEPGYLSGLRKGAGRGWVVCYRKGTKYRIECKAHGTEQIFGGSSADAKALVRTVRMWCEGCQRDADLFDVSVPRGEFQFQLRSQTDPWELAMATIDVPDSHPAFLVSHKSLERFVPEGSSIKIVQPRILVTAGKKGGERRAKRFQATVPIREAQQAIVFLERVATELAEAIKVAADNEASGAPVDESAAE